jgi:hypothetical protein
MSNTATTPPLRAIQFGTVRYNDKPQVRHKCSPGWERFTIRLDVAKLNMRLPSDSLESGPAVRIHFAPPRSHCEPVQNQNRCQEPELRIGSQPRNRSDVRGKINLSFPQRLNEIFKVSVGVAQSWSMCASRGALYLGVCSSALSLWAAI